MSRGPGRPELYPIKKLVGFDQPMLDAIDRWREQQEPIPNVSDAIRSLVEIGLRRTTPAAPTRASKTTPFKSRRPAKRMDESQ